LKQELLPHLYVMYQITASLTHKLKKTFKWKINKWCKTSSLVWTNHIFRAPPPPCNSTC